MYNKVNVRRHQEERECPNCGKKVKVIAFKKQKIEIIR